MIEELDTYDWENAFGENNITLRYERTLTYRDDETLSTASFTREDVEELFHLVEGENDGPSWVSIGRLKDGRFFSIEAGCDYTGWDCQAGGSCTFSKTYEDVIQFGTGDSELERLGIPREAKN